VLLIRHFLTLFLRYPNPPSLLHIIKRMVFFFWRLDYSKISSSVHALSRNKQYSSLKHRHSTVRLHTILPPTTPPDHASIQSHPTHSKHHPHQPKINRLPIVPTGTCPDSQREKPCIPEIHRSASHAGDTGWVASARYCACSEAHMQVHVRSHVAFLRREGTFCLCVPCLCYVGSVVELELQRRV
jgi:hypothetical protein